MAREVVQSHIPQAGSYRSIEFVILVAYKIISGRGNSSPKHGCRQFIHIAGFALYLAAQLRNVAEKGMLGNICIWNAGRAIEHWLLVIHRADIGALLRQDFHSGVD